MNNTDTKNELPPWAIAVSVAGAVAVLLVVFFLIRKSDPASQPPHAPPTVDVSKKAAEWEAKGRSGPMERGPQGASAPSQRPGPTTQ